MNKKHIITFSIAFLLLIAGIAGAYIFNAMTVKLETEISALHTEVSTLSIQSARLLNLRQVVNSTGDDLETLNAFFIEQGGALDFVKYIEGLAAASGLTVRIDFVDEQADTMLTPNDKVFLKTAVRTSGTLKNTRRFLALIESLPYNVKINRVDLRRGTGEGGREEWSALVDFSTVKMIEK